MDSYNSRQKLYVFIAVVIFIVINIIAFVLVIPSLDKGSVKGIYTDSVNKTVLVEGNIEKNIVLEANKEININADSLYVKNTNYSLIALPQSKFKLLEMTTMNIISGIYYIETYSSLTIDNIEVSPSSKVLLDSDEGNIYILKGKINTFGKEYFGGFVLNYHSDSHVGNPILKEMLLSTNKVKEINKLLASRTLFVPELHFVSIPKLEIKDNILESNVTSPFYLIEGKVDASSQVFINTTPITVNEFGEFSYSYELTAGLNNINVTAIDEAANNKTINLQINLTN